jgi:hypothetical protein
MQKEIKQRQDWNRSMAKSLRSCSPTARRFIEQQIDVNRDQIAILEEALELN